ncbi:MAG: circularly permuted type 2 ATP-grasp protein [Saprospiraceae bacterium]|nr:circularly permuted type 2 ATP-grasp protein [Saprospiraceae bacterium]
MIETYLKERRAEAIHFFDELADAQGEIFPHWQKLVKYYDKIGDTKLVQKAADVVRYLKENGVTYNIYGDPEGLNRPWHLDPIPILIESKDWAEMERGVKQRAELMNLILKDIYGSRTLIRQGLLPFDLIYNHQGFLRQVDKVRVSGEHQLIQYSADLARGPNGKMWVLYDRTDAPSGSGYALENRAAMTRVFPDLLRENHISKISSYFQTFRNTLVRLSKQNQDDPRIVLLTPGPSNETYFEHAYLASTLGFILVTGEDLVVRDGYVWLKTISALEKVDVIVRRVDDVFCDPLEFREDSHLGVVGLTEVVRQNKVLLINTLGSRILENPGLMAFLPGLCQTMLGEDLILPSVATWWCGQVTEKKYVLDNIQNLVIRPIYQTHIEKPILGPDLTKEEVSAWKKKIEAKPFLYVGQEIVEFSTSPSLIDGKMVARNTVLRTYAVADYDRQTYEVMQGGLSRSAPEKGAFLVTNQKGGISKDTWVIGSPSTIRTDHRVVYQLRKSEAYIPSSTGENLYWLGRYLERAISLVRYLRIVLRQYNEEESIEPWRDHSMLCILKGLTDLTKTYPGFYDKKTGRDPATELVQIIADYNKIGSLGSTLQSFVRNGYKVRDRLSLDIWRILDSISDEIEALQKVNGDLPLLHGVLDRLIIKLMAFVGLNIDTMSREATWRLVNIGRFIESSINSAQILMILTPRQNEDIDQHLLETVLLSQESLVSYRYKYRSRVEITGVLELLIKEELNPKSLIYQINHCDEYIRKIKSTGEKNLNSAQKKLLELSTLIRLSDIEKLDSTIHGNRKELKILLQKVIQNLIEVSDQIFQTYFAHSREKYAFVSSKLPEI